MGQYQLISGKMDNKEKKNESKKKKELENL